jgi:hypothetical protein
MRVKFVLYVTTVGSPTATCWSNISQGASGVGTATCSFAAQKENVYSVQAELVEVTAASGTTPKAAHEYYDKDTDTQAVNVVAAGTGFTTGGGWFIDPNTNRKSNFGFTVKFLKNGNVQGNSLFIYRRTVNLWAMGVTTAPNEVRDYNFWIKSNSMDSLTQKCSTSTGTEPCWATFTGKSNVKAIDRDTGREYTLGADIIGNQQLFQVDVTDKGEPGASSATHPDGYAIRVWTNSGTFYQVGVARNSMNPPNGTQVDLKGGNIQVRMKN